MLPRPPNTTGLIRRTERYSAADDQQAWPPQPPAVVAFNPANGFPWNLDDGERFYHSQCWPDPTTDLLMAFGPPLNAVSAQALNGDPELWQQLPNDDPSVQSYAIGPPAGAFNPATGFPWTVNDDERFVTDQTVTEPDSATAFGFSAFDPSQGFPWNADDGERFVQSVLVGEDWQAWAIQPPAVAAVTQLTAFAVEGGEVQSVAGTDDSVQSWAIGPPQNAVIAQAFNQPDEAREVPVEDPTVPTYAIQPPPYTPVFQVTAWPVDGGETQAVPGDDPSIQSWAVGPPLNATALTAWNPERDFLTAPTVDDDSAQSWAVQPLIVAFDPSTVTWTGRDDITQPVWAIADDTSQAWAVQPPTPIGFFNQPDEPVIPAWMVPDDNGGVWTATLGAVTVVTGGFPPGGSAVNAVPGGFATAPGAPGTASSSTPGGVAANPKPGAA